MAIDLNSGDGLFDRLGKLGHLLNTINTLRGSTSSGYVIKETQDAIDAYNADIDLRQLVGPETLTRDMLSAQNGFGSLASRLRKVAEATLIEMAHADNPLPAKTLAEALAELKRQMVSASETVDASEPSSSTSYDAGNGGNGRLVVSLVDGYGRRLENAFAEDLRAICTSASSAGAEQLSVRGEAAQRDPLHWNWPAGSGASVTLTSTRAASSGNLLANGTFETFTVANTPDSWTIVTGSAGSQIYSSSSPTYVATKCLRFAGDGSTLTQIKQSPSSTLTALKPYAVHFFARMDSSPAAGVLTVDLFDGSSVIADDAGTNNSFTVDLTALSTSWVGYGGVFRLPTPAPSTVELRLRLSTALSNTKNLYIDEVQLRPAMAAYAGGPYLAAFTGSTGWSVDDMATVAVTNARAGAFSTLFERLFATRQKGFWLPSATGGAETIDDALIG